MRRQCMAVGAALAGLACVLTGCAGPPAQPGSVTAPGPATPAPAPVPQPAPLPPPGALTDVIYRLADPAVPGADKLALVQDGAPADAAVLDRFATALRDGGFDPVEVSATDVAPGGRPGEVVATIEIRPAGRESRDGFRFPLEFRPAPGGWQLTRGTAEMLLPAP